MEEKWEKKWVNGSELAGAVRKFHCGRLNNVFWRCFEIKKKRSLFLERVEMFGFRLID